MINNNLRMLPMWAFFSTFLLISCSPPSEAKTQAPEPTKSEAQKQALKTPKQPKNIKPLNSPAQNQGNQAPAGQLSAPTVTAEELGKSLGIKKGDKLIDETCTGCLVPP